MKKTAKNLTTPTAQKKSKLDPLSNTNESNPIIDGADKFVLFPLDIQETIPIIINPITQNTATSEDDDFILFPLDVNKTSTNVPAPIANQKPNKQKKQFVTNPSPQPLVNPQPVPSPIPPYRPTYKKLRNIFWSLVICLSIYTCNKKESSESYTHFFNKTINKFGTPINLLKSIFITEDDFKKFKKDKKIIVTSPGWNFGTQRLESTYFNHKKGDSIIIIELTKRRDLDRIEVKYMYNKFEDFKLNKMDTLWVLESLLNTNLDALKSSKIESSSNSMVGVFIKYEWIENDLFTFRDEEGNKKYFTDVPQNCVLYNENGVNENNYNKKFKIKWVVDNQSYEYSINKITQIELIK